MIAAKALKEYSDKAHFVYVFANGKGLKVPVSLYETKSARKKLVNAYSGVSPIVGAFYEEEPFELFLVNSAGRAININTKLIPEKATRTAAGTMLFRLPKGQTVVDATVHPETHYEGYEKCRKIKIPATGTTITVKK